VRDLRLWGLVIVAALFGIWQTAANWEFSHPPGVLVAEDPIQQNLAGPPPTFEKAGFKITALARFDAKARVLRIEKYHFDRIASLVPEDFALGWGPMSDTAVLDAFKFTQGNRFYFYGWRGEPPIPVPDIVSHSANMHLIPASASVEKRLAAAHPGSILHFTGYLVRAEAADGWKIVSSLTRTDTGAGACEVVWVEEADSS
jgi:hypothetical protein